MSVQLVGTRRCEGCSSPARTCNAFTNGIGWRELCDRCTNGVRAFAFAHPAPALTVIAR